MGPGTNPSKESPNTLNKTSWTFYKKHSFYYNSCKMVKFFIDFRKCFKCIKSTLQWFHECKDTWNFIQSTLILSALVIYLELCEFVS